MDILVTTLGKATSKQGGRYSTLNYRFDDGFEFVSSFFMLALLEYRKHLNRTPDKVLVLGTASSMWDALLEQTSLEDLALVETLLQESKAGAVTSGTLERLGRALTGLFGVNIQCVLIPLGRTSAEQAEVLRIIAEQIPEKATVCFDLTHGYRTLPLLELLSVFYLIQVRQARISDIVYGAADMRDETTCPATAPVIRLDFIKDMLAWLTTLPLAEQTGRYDKLAGLFQEESPLATALTRYSLHLRTNQTAAAHASAEEIDALLQQPFADPVAELYRPALQRKLNWRSGDDLAVWQILSAKAALRSGDLLRATVLLREARISLELPPDQQAVGEAREQVNSKLNRDTDQHAELLTALRNCLAHAAIPGLTATGRRVSRLLTDNVELTETLQQIADQYYEQSRNR